MKPLKITIEGKKNGQPAIKWTGVALAYLAIVVIMGLTLLTLHGLSKVALGYSLLTINGWVNFSVFLCVLAAPLLGIWVRIGLSTPLDELPNLD